MFNYPVDPRLTSLLEFIRKHSDWQSLIQQPPYSVIVKTNGPYVLLKYNMYSSDTSLPIVQACRGIILDISSTPKVVCHSFNKFFNQGEKKVQYLDNGSKQFLEDLYYHVDYGKPHEVQEKLDGSMLRLWYHNSLWHVSTSGTIDAFQAKVNTTERSFEILFWEALAEDYSDKDLLLNSLNKNWCYTFELIHPESRLVVKYPKPKLYLLTAFDTSTLQELNIRTIPELRTLKFSQPVIYPDSFLQQLSTIDNFEGCVITQVDSEGILQRVKLKAENYLKIFHVLDQSQSNKQLFKLVLEDQVDDILAQYPEYADRVNFIKNWFNENITSLNNILNSVEYNLPRSEFALLYKERPHFNHLMKKYQDRNYTAENFFLNPDNFYKLYELFRKSTGAGE